MESTRIPIPHGAMADARARGGGKPRKVAMADAKVHGDMHVLQECRSFDSSFRRGRRALNHGRTSRTHRLHPCMLNNQIDRIAPPKHRRFRGRINRLRKRRESKPGSNALDCAHCPRLCEGRPPVGVKRGWCNTSMAHALSTAHPGRNKAASSAYATLRRRRMKHYQPSPPSALQKTSVLDSHKRWPFGPPPRQTNTVVIFTTDTV